MSRDDKRMIQNHRDDTELQPTGITTKLHKAEKELQE